MIYIARAAVMAAAVLGIISLAANVFYGLAITAGPERYLYATGGGIADAIKIAIPAVIGWTLWSNKVQPWSGPVLAGWLIWILCTAWSFQAGAGLFEVLRSANVADTQAVRAEFSTLDTRRKRLETELSSIRVPEDPSARLAEMQHSVIFSRTKQCTDVTRSDSRAWCSEYSGLVARAKAVHTTKARVAALETRLSETLGKLDKLDQTKAHKAADPATAEFAEALGIDQSVLRTAMAMLIGAVIELVASLTAFVMAPALHTRELEKPVSGALTASEPTDISRWLSEWTSTGSGWTNAADALGSYNAWARANQGEPMSQRDFGQQMSTTEVIRRKSGRIQYGLTLVRGAGLRLVSG